MYDNCYHSTAEQWQNYFAQFAVLSDNNAQQREQRTSGCTFSYLEDVWKSSSPD